MAAEARLTRVMEYLSATPQVSWADLFAIGWRWYVAWHPECAEAVWRFKSGRGLEAWRTRSWEMFPGPPEIANVTESTLAWIAQRLDLDPARKSQCWPALFVSPDGGAQIVDCTAEWKRVI